MKKLQVIAAGLGYKLLERNGMTEIAGLEVRAKGIGVPGRHVRRAGDAADRTFSV